MDDHTRALGDLPPEALHGGLHGRLAGHFGVLQSSVDALQRYLAVNTDPQVQATAGVILNEMSRRIAQADRLSGSAVDLLLGECGALSDRPHPVELCALLRDFCENANLELALIGGQDRVAFENRGPGARWVMGEGPLLDRILVNLLSNSLRAARPARCSVALLEDGAILYSDQGGGMADEAAQRLLCGTPLPTDLAEGRTGLLLIRSCAQAMEWRLSLPQTPGGFGLLLHPGQPAAAPVGALWSGAAEQRRRAMAQRAAIRRELDGALL